MKFRFTFLISLVTLIFLSLGYNLYILQVDRGEYYFNRAQAQQTANVSAVTPRGTIYFNGKVPAVMNRDFSVIYAVPTQIQDGVETA
ncbi:MAG: hypothetical protein WC810_27065, partial [Janthinobacterium sp.]